MKRLFSRCALVLVFFLILASITTSVWQPATPQDAIRPATRPYEFDYTSWILDAFINKLSMLAAGYEHYLTNDQERAIIRDYFQLVNDTLSLENALEAVYSDSSIENPGRESAKIRSELDNKQAELKIISSLAEVVIQNQVATALEQMQIPKLGQPFPPVLYHVSDLPKELVISPRNVIEMKDSISLDADLELDEIIALEEKVEEESDYSALVVSVGGVAAYPTMVTNTTSLSHLIDTVAHEWVHNYLNLRPLGLRYSESPELRTMNETTASIAGAEISRTVLQLFYADLLESAPPTDTTYEAGLENLALYANEDDAAFDFRREMYNTRLNVDQLLSQGKIQEAEDYMEERREFLWENGYAIRKLNQAYFAFHGAYAEEEYGAAGKDPVGAAVRALRSRSKSLADFLHSMSSITSPAQLHLLVYAY